MSRARFKDDSGAAAVIVAILIVVLTGFVALAVDVGYLIDTRRQLQSAADAAALAGCDVLIETEDPGAAQAAAAEYAQLNATGPGAGLVVQSIDVQSSAEPWSVTVVVRRTVPAWFARIFGTNSSDVRANAKAEKSRLSGARYLMPWAVPIILDEDVDRVEAKLVNDSGTVVSGPVQLSDSGGRQYAGSLSAPSSQGGYDLQVSAFNVFGVEEWVGDSKGVQPAARVMVSGATYPFATIELSEDYLPSDDPSYPTLTVTTVQPQPKGVKVDIGKFKRSMEGTGTIWTYTLSGSDLAFDDGFLTTTPIDLYTGNKADGTDAYVHVRRSTYPFSAVTAAPTVTGPGGTVDVTVDLNEFDPTTLVPGQIYELRVGSDGVETGNFGELNYNGIVHQGSCPADPVGVDLGNNVKDWVADGYGGGVHIGDIIPMSPGKSGWVPRVVDDHIAKYGDIVAMPVVAKYEQKDSGTYDVIVRKFAAFRIVDYGNSGGEKGIVTAEFLEYIATPHEYEPPGSGTGTVYSARLVNP